MLFLSYVLSLILTMGTSGATVPAPDPGDAAAEIAAIAEGLAGTQLSASSTSGASPVPHEGPLAPSDAMGSARVATRDTATKTSAAKTSAAKTKKTKKATRAARARAAKVARASRPTPPPAPTPSTDEYNRANPPVQTPFMVASFNALGSSHTDGKKPQRKGYAHSTTRMRNAVALFNTRNLDVIALQEFQPPQKAAFTAAAGTSFGLYVQGANAVAWRTSKFEFVTAATLPVPYLGGTPTPMPIVLLKSITTGQEMVFISVHNPADARGPAQHWRNAAVAQELEYLRYLRSTPRPVPMFLLGDMNDRERFFCPITATGDMHSASGGSNVNGTCVHPPYRGVNWVTGSTGVTFSRFLVNTSPVTRRLSDHPLVIAQAG